MGGRLRSKHTNPRLKTKHNRSREQNIILPLMMSRINFNDAQSTRVSPINCVEDTSKHKQTDPLLFIDYKKMKANDDVNNGPAFNGTALTSNELAILWRKFRMDGHFKVEDDSMSQNTIASSTSSLSLSSQLNNNFINREQYSNNQCDKEFDNACVENDSLVVNIHRETPISYELSEQFMPNYSLYELCNQNCLLNTPNPCIYNNQSEFIAHDNQNSFIDISNNRYQLDVESIRSDEYIVP